MTLIDTSVRIVHVAFAATWTGGTLLFAGAVLPAAGRGVLDAEALSWMTRRFSYLSMAAVAILFATGGHLAGTLYTFETLASTGRGHLVLAMLGLWLVLGGVLHVGPRRLQGALEEHGPSSAAAASDTWFRAAAIVSVALLVVAGAL